MMSEKNTRLVVVSNRLPVILTRVDNNWKIQSGSGGLVTALAPVLRDRGGLWIGWPGDVSNEPLDHQMREASKQIGYKLSPVHLTKKDVRGFYLGFSNEIIWPLFHDMLTRCNYVPEYWENYLDVNRKFAKAIAENTDEDDYIWIHDYHLISVAQELINMNQRRKTGFFLHIPFPTPDIYVKLPWRRDMLMNLLQYNLVGFQTPRDKRNFLMCLQALFRGIKMYGKGPILNVRYDERDIRIGSFPISIDFGEFANKARNMHKSTSDWNLNQTFPGKTIILGVDRLDYTKGIPEKLNAYRRALTKYKDLQGNVTLVQLIVPSRESVNEYRELKAEIDQLIGEINGQMSQPGWIPIHYAYGSLSREDLVLLYRTSDIALVTPLKDGMNLVAKEYCACHVDNDGVLILSEFAGAAAQMGKAALLVNPHDLESIADVIYEAFVMDNQEKKKRMKKLRDNIKKYDIFWWVDSFLETAFAKHLKDFQHLMDHEERLRMLTGD